ncbi:DUF397 domain-containing protein [Streptomyces sp. NPDC005141]
MNTPLNWQKSSFSGSGDGNACLELATVPVNWQKSSFSGGGEGNDCVELATTPGTVHLRESDAPGTRLSTARGPLAHLLNHIKTRTSAVVADDDRGHRIAEELADARAKVARQILRDGFQDRRRGLPLMVPRRREESASEGEG